MASNMPDKKLTDSEIIKELECAKQWFTEHGRNTNTAIVGICERALDLINRLQAEKERLQSMNQAKLDMIHDLQAENERLKEKINTAKAMVNETIPLVEQDIKTAKTEAYKEFAESAVERVDNAKQKYQRLCKEQGEEMEEHMHIHFYGITKIINNLLKELVGEDQ